MSCRESSKKAMGGWGGWEVEEEIFTEISNIIKLAINEE